MCCSHHHHQPNRPSQQPKPILKLGVGIASSLILIVAGSAYWSQLKTPRAAAIQYSPAEVDRTQPLRAEHIHEMGAETPIPFLPKDKPQPEIVVPETTYDFGSVGPKEIVKQTFLIRNTGQGPLTISRAYTTCGCTIADFSSAVIPPGKVSLVTVTFDAGFHDTRGMKVRRGVIIENNDPRHSKVEIWLTANVRQN